jgi:hypothetical protein
MKNLVRKSLSYALVALIISTSLHAPLNALADSQDPEVYCQIMMRSYNQHRQITGSVSVECPGGVHSAPWGNWGVVSYHGTKYDGFQFAGWHSLDGWLQWNSCTTHFNYGSTRI